ncbi:MAG: branched-chain amino acid transport system substrate-binding protein [Candidatus Eremiobacteraeota bacterium]|jgi:branched-chain amino acid transport system substrate-binding protein|nr:branched-chain amino acid transport system substrate-binding protein [Candidatus Eremiobacteraeota bacterium]
MRVFNRLRGVVIVTVALALSGWAAPGGAASGVIKIGVPVPLSGNNASAGEDLVNGAKLAAADINRKGGVNGMKIEIVPADDACDAQTAAQAADKLMAQGVVAVAGGYCSGAALPELTAFHRQGIPYVLDASTNPQLTELGYKEAFRVIGRDDQQAPFAANFIATSLRAKTAAVLNDNTTYGKGLADSLVTALGTRGVKVVFNDSITPGQSDYTATLTKIRGAQPDVFYYAGYYAEFSLLVKEAKQLELKARLIGSDANQSPVLIKTAGSAAEGTIVTTAPLPQFISGAQGFVKAYEKAYGKSAGPYSAYEYDAVSTVAQAIKAARSTDPKRITAALASLKSFKGITGDIAFTPKGDRTGINYISVIVRNGQFAPYKKLDKAGRWVDGR